MRIFKLLSLLFICVSLVYTGFANATMLCCKRSQSVAEIGINMDHSKAQMLCHESTKKDENKIKMKHGQICVSCKNCLSTNAITPYIQQVYKVTFANIIHNALVNSFSSIALESIYSPPKQIS